MGEVIDLQAWLDKRAIEALIKGGAGPAQAADILAAFDASLLAEVSSEENFTPCDTE